MRNTFENQYLLVMGKHDFPIFDTNIYYFITDTVYSFHIYPPLPHPCACTHTHTHAHTHTHEQIQVSDRDSFICQGTSTRRQRSDRFDLRIKLPLVTTSLTTIPLSALPIKEITSELVGLYSYYPFSMRNVK